jgi:hypothetical protein
MLHGDYLLNYLMLIFFFVLVGFQLLETRIVHVQPGQFDIRSASSPKV